MLKMFKSAKSCFTEQERSRIERAIRDAELETSGEIRVHIETRCPGEVLDRAAYIFEKLNMHKTKMRNGVLIYLALESRKFAFIGDIGINSVVPKDFWESLKMNALIHFREGRFTDGLVEVIGEIGHYIQKYFPIQRNDVNELPNEISFGDE